MDVPLMSGDFPILSVIVLLPAVAGLAMFLVPKRRAELAIPLSVGKTWRRLDASPRVQEVPAASVRAARSTPDLRMPSSIGLTPPHSPTAQRPVRFMRVAGSLTEGKWVFGNVKC